ncbi:hypothetical protein IFM89_013973 [Coptis chinensis]|uniref:Protein JASON n=1 Tax=Coptis chinensis TaxID=261450 RepID=A0A835IPW0_9MAGN|nr:hypothetical protein IFM89_013973 [Coptis chinensis]
MNCLFRCFCVTAANDNVDDVTPTPPKKDVSASRNRLATLLRNEANEGSSPCQESIGSELKAEAKFLKSCGALLETPVEIRKASGRVKAVLPHNEGSANTKFHSWLPTTSIENLHLGGQQNQFLVTPVEVSDSQGKESGSPGQEHTTSSTSCSFSSGGQNLAVNNSLRSPGNTGVESPDTDGRTSSYPSDNDSLFLTPELPVLTNQCKNKSVRFECESNTVYLPSSGTSEKQTNSPGRHLELKDCPYPTPLVLTDEMQTPGTVYPISAENLGHRDKGRIRSQYVNPTLNPVHNFSQLMALKEDSYYNHEGDDSQNESLEQNERGSSARSYAANTGRENTYGKEAIGSSLSHWLKPLPSSRNVGDQNSGCKSSGGSQTGKTSDLDRPIIGTVAAHWSEDEPSQISPKWWDGNGIPNSTNKYKEDQKVSWHATPFEERLEKALSNESVVNPRRISCEPIEFVENEESDTAVSRLHTSKHPESVVSF